MDLKMKSQHQEISMFEGKVETRAIKDYDYKKTRHDAAKLKVALPIKYSEEYQEGHDGLVLDEEHDNPYKNIQDVCPP